MEEKRMQNEKDRKCMNKKKTINNKVNMATLSKNNGGGGDGNGWWFKIQLKNIVHRYNVRTV